MSKYLRKSKKGRRTRRKKESLLGSYESRLDKFFGVNQKPKKEYHGKYIKETVIKKEPEQPKKSLFTALKEYNANRLEKQKQKDLEFQQDRMRQVEFKEHLDRSKIAQEKIDNERLGVKKESINPYQ